jgi:hypothetical protein
LVCDELPFLCGSPSLVARALGVLGSRTIFDGKDGNGKEKIIGVPTFGSTWFDDVRN